MTTVVKETFLRILTMSGVTLRKEAIAAVEESSQVDMAKEIDISKVGLCKEHKPSFMCLGPAQRAQQQLIFFKTKL